MAKTAMQKLIDYINFVKLESGHLDLSVSATLDYAKKLLAQERQQIENAFQEGVSYWIENEPSNIDGAASDYYTKTYNNEAAKEKK